ncbi:hypothetical protein [Tsukamurella sp. NPDC003166]|uniref:hypothetical protein n=1 Tax=Tsukamurella sp. NPDC003166 TaxID=3154444 RepID=UPI0033BF00ED
MNEPTEVARQRARDAYWRTVARRTAAHLAQDLSKETGVPISAAVQRVLDEEALENAKTA